MAHMKYNIRIVNYNNRPNITKTNIIRDYFRNDLGNDRKMTVNQSKMFYFTDMEKERRYFSLVSGHSYHVI